jgi:hypothetical protein
MSDNATLNQKVQIGVESTYATGVDATKRIQSFAVDFDPQAETDDFIPPGNLFPSSSSIIQEWMEAEISGILTYTEIVYLLTVLFGPATITTPAGGTNSRQWKWTINASDVLSPKSLTVEKGSSVYATEFVGALLSSFNFGWSRTDRIEIGGSMFGKPLALGTTMTSIASNATVPIIRVLPQQVSIYNAATWAGLDAASAYTRAFEAGLSIDGLFSPIWPLNAAVNGFDGFVPTVPDSDSSLLMMVNAASMAMLTNLRNDTITYNRIKSEGATIEGAIKYLLQIDMTVQVKDIDAFTDHDGVYAIPYTFQPIDDGTNPTFEITVINTLSAL